MALVGMFIIIFLLIFDFIKNKNLFSPFMMFGTLFLLVVILASLKLFGISDFSNKSVLLIELGVFFFAIGSFFSEDISYYFYDRRTKYDHDIEKLEINLKFTELLLGIVTVGNVISFFYSVKFLLAGGTIFQIRAMFLGYNDMTPLVSNSVLQVLINYIASPGLYALIPIAMVYLIQRQHIEMSIIVLLNLLFSVLSSGGRILMVYTVLQFFAVLTYSKIKISPRTKRNIFLIVVVMIISLVVISSLRSSNGLMKSFYTYFSAPVVLFSHWIDIADTGNINSYGLAFVYPFTYLINVLNSSFGITNTFVTSVVAWQQLPQDIWVNVFPNQPMNAFCTLFYFFYQDFRGFGIAIFSFIFGCVSSFVYVRAYLQHNVKYFVIYLLGIKAIIGSFIIWQLGSTSFFLSLVLLLICLGKLKTNSSNDRL